MSDEKLSHNKQTRISPKSIALLRVFAGERQFETTKKYTDDSALQELFRIYRPDILEKVETILKKGE